jgi:NTP pyrophosphatase (non-canonical NTP hydrolase)
MSQRHFNGLTEEEHEALSLLMEECGEVVQAIGKIMRHGLDSDHPGTLITNRDALAKEVSDVQCSIKILLRDGVIDQKKIDKARREKIRKLRTNFRHVLHHIDPL